MQMTMKKVRNKDIGSWRNVYELTLKIVDYKSFLIQFQMLK